MPRGRSVLISSTSFRLSTVSAETLEGAKKWACPPATPYSVLRLSSPREKRDSYYHRLRPVNQTPSNCFIIAVPSKLPRSPSSTTREKMFANNGASLPYFESRDDAENLPEGRSDGPTGPHTSVIVRPNGLLEEMGPQGPPASMGCYPTTPTASYYSGTPGYPSPYSMNFPFLFTHDWPFQFPHGDGTTSPSLSHHLPSPILGNPAIANRLNPLGSQLHSSAGRHGLHDFSVSSSPMGQYNPKKSGRRPRELSEEMEDEDQDKRIKRRQRNKEAAARCRQRRLDLMTSLQEQVDRYRSDNDRKTAEIRVIRSKMDQMESFLRNHDCKMTTAEREAALPKFGGQLPSFSATSSSHPNPPPAISTTSAPMQRHEYQPPRFTPSLGNIKRPLSSSQLPLPARTENGLLEPDAKIIKLEVDPPLNQMNHTEDVERPSALPLANESAPVAPLTTPSRMYNTVPTFNDNFALPSSLFSSGPMDVSGDFLAQNTGLTPSGQPQMSFVNTPTPMHTADADLRPL
ncbi:unnamed protein product [Caenorhabditis auriculariae]|uniref:BZIP domain-containing protein n=1 Tax=Caenorhabditis auriculariae TaxID=2777116 RepID=A0A8S1H7H7_9PELO|nr:unnamed protein product [Caenorhabditis auriculariae]